MVKPRIGSPRFFIFILFFTLQACSPVSLKEDSDSWRADSYFDLMLQGKAIEVQLAVEPVEQQRGLMFRKKLGENKGMIFIYARPQQMRFWMRNTPLPLDIGYFSPDGILQEFYPLYPYDETPVVSREDNVQFALEMSQGWFQNNGINSGAVLDLEMLKNALRLRNYDPSDFNLDHSL